MNSQKSLQSIDSTGIKNEDQSPSSQSPLRWKQLQSKYLKYIALLKSKADKSKKKLNNNHKTAHLVYCLKYKIQKKLMDAFKNIELTKKEIQIKMVKAPQAQNNKKGQKETKIDRVKQLVTRIQSIINKHRKGPLSQINKFTKQLRQKSLKKLTKPPKMASPSKKQSFGNHKNISAINKLKKLQSTMNNIPVQFPDNQLLTLKLKNSKLKQQTKMQSNKIIEQSKEIQMIHQRMQMQLLKKSLALMQSQVDSQQKDELIKQYQIQLQCRLHNNNRVLLFSLQDFEVQRRRLQMINQKLYKQFQNTKQTFVEEIKNQNIIINELKSKLGKVNNTLSQNTIELESLRAYRFQNQYERQCEKYQQYTRFHSLKLPSQVNKQKNSITLLLLKHIESLILKQSPQINIHQKLSLQQSNILQSIQEKVSFIPQTTIKNKVIRLNSLQKSIAFQQNIKISTQDLNSFLDMFQRPLQSPNLSIDLRIQQQLQCKILSLNQRLFDIRQMILSLLQSIQIRNPTKQLLILLQHINDTFEFSQTQKQLFNGGRKSLFQRMFS